MAAPGIPSNFNIQPANSQVFLSWDITVGATSYQVQRSADGVTFAVIASPAVPKYLDSTAVNGTQYWYKVAATNGSGTSAYTSAQTTVPAPDGEMALLTLRRSAQEKADRVGSNFVTLTEWNKFINLACNELYDLLIAAYEDYFMAPRAQFTSTANTFIYALPNGTASFTGLDGQSFVAPAFYKLLGVDLGLNTANSAFVTIHKYNMIDRNKYVYPNSGGTQYGVFNMRYRLVGNKIEFIPPPSANQVIQLLYIPRLTPLLQDTDITTIGYGGWLQYVIVRAAKYALDKEESDTSKLDSELLFLKERIEAIAQNRDAGQPDTISDTRGSSDTGSAPFSGFPSGGW
jgi:hypothetical protein